MPLPVLERLPELARRRAALLFAAGLAALLAILFSDPLFTHRTFADRDLAPFFLPIEKAVHEAWQRGQVPLLLPEVSFGKPLAANPNTGAFYPPRIAMAILPFTFSFKLFPILHLWLAAVGAFLLARDLGVSRPSSALAGMTFALCGPALSDITYPDFLPGLVLLPFVVWAAGRLARSPSARTAALVGLFWGIALLAGDVFSAGLALVGATLFSAQEAPAGGRVKTLGLMALALASGFLLAGIQIVPAALLTPLTVRATGPLRLGEAVQWSASPWRAVEFLLPFPFGNTASEGVVWGEGLWSGKTTGFFNTLYCGAFATTAFLWCRPARGKRLFLYGLAAISASLASTGFFLPGSLAQKVSPVPLRYPEKFVVGLVLVLALMSGLALDSLFGRGGRRISLVPAAIALFLLAAAMICAGRGNAVADFADRHWSTLAHEGFFAAQRLPALLRGSAARWALLSGVLFLGTSRRAPRAMLAIALFVLVDLDSVRRSFVTTEPETLVFSLPPSVRAIRRITRPPAYGFTFVQDLSAPSDPFRRSYRPWLDEVRATLRGDFGALFGVVYSFNGDYDLSDFSRVKLARRAIPRDASRSRGMASYLAAFSARAAITRRGSVPDGFPRPVNKLKPEWIVVNDEALPTVRFASDVMEVRDVREAFAAVLSPKVSLSKTTIVESDRARRRTLGSGRIAVQRWNPNGILLRTFSEAPTELVVARAYSPFRRTLVDGVATAALPADLCLTAVPLPAGSHTVQIFEELPGGAAGPALSACGVLLLLYLARRSTRHAA